MHLDLKKYLLFCPFLIAHLEFEVRMPLAFTFPLHLLPGTNQGLLFLPTSGTCTNKSPEALLTSFRKSTTEKLLQMLHTIPSFCWKKPDKLSPQLNNEI